MALPVVPCRCVHGWVGNTQDAGPPEQPRTFGAHGRGAVVGHGWEDTGVVADVGIGLPADVAIVRVESGGAGDEIGTNWKERGGVTTVGLEAATHRLCLWSLPTCSVLPDMSPNTPKTSSGVMWVSWALLQAF